MAKRVHNRELIARLLEIVVKLGGDNLTAEERNVVDKANDLLRPF